MSSQIASATSFTSLSDAAMRPYLAAAAAAAEQNVGVKPECISQLLDRLV
jgi:hypothetical protein